MTLNDPINLIVARGRVAEIDARVRTVEAERDALTSERRRLIAAIEALWPEAERIEARGVVLRAEVTNGKAPENGAKAPTTEGR